MLTKGNLRRISEDVDWLIPEWIGQRGSFPPTLPCLICEGHFVDEDLYLLCQFLNLIVARSHMKPLIEVANELGFAEELDRQTKEKGLHPGHPHLAMHRLGWFATYLSHLGMGDINSFHQFLKKRMTGFGCRFRRNFMHNQIIFVSSTFRQMKSEREALFPELCMIPRAHVWQPKTSEDHALQFMEEISTALTKANAVLLLIGSSPGSVYEFIDPETVLEDIRSRETSGLPLPVYPDLPIDQLKPFLVRTGESFTQIEARFFSGKPDIVSVFIARDWLRQFEELKRQWERRGIRFHVSHLEETACESGECWDPPPNWSGRCRVDYLMDRYRQVRDKGRFDPDPKDPYADMTEDDWKQVSWIQFTQDILASKRFQVQEYGSINDLREKTLAAVGKKVKNRLSGRGWLLAVFLGVNATLFGLAVLLLILNEILHFFPE